MTVNAKLFWGVLAGIFGVWFLVHALGCTPAQRASTEAKAATASAVACAIAHASTGKAAAAVATACDIELEMAEAIVRANGLAVAGAGSAQPFIMLTIPTCPSADAGAP